MTSNNVSNQALATSEIDKTNVNDFYSPYKPYNSVLPLKHSKYSPKCSQDQCLKLKFSLSHPENFLFIWMA